MFKFKVLFIRDFQACNTSYLTFCTYWLKRLSLIQFTEIKLEHYLEFNHDGFDIAIYAPFPSEVSPVFLAKSSLISKTDQKFLNFKGRKILFDCHDHGNIDAFTRLSKLDESLITLLPRIKTAPHQDYLKKHNVVMSTTYPIGVNPPSPSYNYIGNLRLNSKNIERNVTISCRVNIGKKLEHYRYQIRKNTIEILQNSKYSELVDTVFRNDPDFKSYLSRVLISVCPPGYGPGTFRHLQSFNAQALTLSHESINPIKLLPNVDLVENEDYISYNLDNLIDKLDELLNDQERINKIAKNGFRKFSQGYSTFKSTWNLYKLLLQLA